MTYSQAGTQPVRQIFCPTCRVPVNPTHCSSEACRSSICTPSLLEMLYTESPDCTT